MHKQYSLHLSDIPEFAKTIAPQLQGGDILAVIGPLGSGKTTFTKALGKQLKISRHITSPTFVIMNRYPARLGDKKIWLYHLDLYRTKNFTEVKALGLQEVWQQPDNLTIIEWADKIKARLPKRAIIIRFTST